jgi:hypothetical protein
MWDEENQQFTLDHLFEGLEMTRETLADVKKVMVNVTETTLSSGERYNDVSFFIETEQEFYGGSMEFFGSEYHQLIENYYGWERIKGGETSTEFLRGFFDDEMLEFLNVFRPIFLFNERCINITDLLTKDIQIPLK